MPQPSSHQPSLSLANNSLTGHFTFVFMGHSYTQCALALCCILNARFSILALISLSSRSISGFLFYLWSSLRPRPWPLVAIFHLLSCPPGKPVVVTLQLRAFPTFPIVHDHIFDCCAYANNHYRVSMLCLLLHLPHTNKFHFLIPLDDINSSPSLSSVHYS
jgi:hypothetical protein